jgi:PAS domain S-box-containing protein
MSKKLPSSAALHETVEQFHILVDSVESTPFYLLDPSGNVITWNTGAEKIKGYSRTKSSEKTSPRSIQADDVAAGKPQRNLREASRRGSIRDQGLRVRKDGSTFEAEVVITALRDATGELRGFSKGTRDITDQIRQPGV